MLIINNEKILSPSLNATNVIESYGREMQPRSQGSPNCPSISQRGLVGENLVNEVERDVFFY